MERGEGGAELRIAHRPQPRRAGGVAARDPRPNGLDHDDVAQPADHRFAAHRVPLDLLGEQVEGGAECRAAGRAHVDDRWQRVEEPACDRVLQAQPAADQFGQRAAVSVAQHRVVVGVVLVGKVGDVGELVGVTGVDAVAGAVRHQREVAGFELVAHTFGFELAAPGRDGVEPDAVRHRRQRPSPRHPQERRAVEDAGDRDVSQRIGDGGDGDRLVWHVSSVPPSLAM